MSHYARRSLLTPCSTKPPCCHLYPPYPVSQVGWWWLYIVRALLHLTLLCTVAFSCVLALLTSCHHVLHFKYGIPWMIHTTLKKCITRGQYMMPTCSCSSLHAFLGHPALSSVNQAQRRWRRASGLWLIDPEFLHEEILISGASSIILELF